MVARRVALKFANARCFSSSHGLNLRSAVIYVARNRTLAQLGCSPRAVGDKKRLVRDARERACGCACTTAAWCLPRRTPYGACRSNRLLIERRSIRVCDVEGSRFGEHPRSNRHVSRSAAGQAGCLERLADAGPAARRSDAPEHSPARSAAVARLRRLCGRNLRRGTD